jgi:hypothetical protein
MSFENKYKRFAAASLDLTEKAKDLPDKVGVLIMAEAWLDLVEQTTQLVSTPTKPTH